VDADELFSRNLIRLRKLRGLTQRQLADMTGISYRMICHYETRATSTPINKLKIIADALQVHIADFFDETASDNPLDDLDVRWLKKLQDIKRLPEADQKEINKHIGSLLQKLELSKQVEQNKT
jgi:transcriptional regulator with XRE-family HTH domain